MQLPIKGDSYGRVKTVRVDSWIHLYHVDAKSLPHGLRVLTYDHGVVILIISYDPIQHFCPSWLLLPPICDEQELQQTHYLSSQVVLQGKIWVTHLSCLISTAPNR